MSITADDFIIPHYRYTPAFTHKHEACEPQRLEEDNPYQAVLTKSGGEG